MNNQIHITETDLVRAGISREKAARALRNINPVGKRGRGNLYDFSTALKALLTADETPRERVERLQGDVMEAKLARMNGEVFKAQETTLLFVEVLTRMRDAIKASDIPSLTDKRKLCACIRSELERLPKNLNDCKFPEAPTKTTDQTDPNE